MCAKAVVDGLILREYRTENDKILTILTSNGRISVSAKGAKSPRSQMLSVTNLFTYGNFEYYEKGGTMIYYVPATGEDVEVCIPRNCEYKVSGNNVDGYIITCTDK